MTDYLDIAETKLQSCKGYWTAREIAQQPDVWAEVSQIIEGDRSTLDAWLAPLLALPNLRIILTGAGTSAYVGETLKPHLTKHLPRTIIEAISTTDLVSNPDQYFRPTVPTLLISYARSGNSPESVAACEFADQFVSESHHLIITCNKDSALASHAAGAKSGYCLLMPEATLDQSFAMTSSFTSMLLATLCVFSPDDDQLQKVISVSRTLLDTELRTINEQACAPYKRIAYLGSGGLLGLATEAKLKMLELTRANIDCYAESPLGFRHGPKFIVNADTMIVLLNSCDPYSKQYDHDLMKELISDRQTQYLYSMKDMTLFAGTGLDDVWLSLPYIIYCQLLAFYKSISLGISPDNPSPSGEVNRVVQGVAIYPFEA